MRGKSQFYLGQVVGAGGQRYWRLLVRRNGVVKHVRMLGPVNTTSAQELEAVRRRYSIESRKERSLRLIRARESLEETINGK